MPSLKSLTKKKILVDLGFQLSTIYASTISGEDFAPQYKKNRKLFTKLVSREIALRRAIRSWQIAFKKEIPAFVNWTAFRSADKKNLLVPDIHWEQKVKELRQILLKQLEPTIGMGFQYGLDMVKKPLDLSVDDPAI